MLEKLKDKLLKTTTQAVELIKVPNDVREERLSICMSCPELVHTINMCSKCGCLVPAKTWLPGTKCPIKKWDIYKV
jgi:hypothetical protein